MTATMMCADPCMRGTDRARTVRSRPPGGNARAPVGHDRTDICR